MCVGRSCPPRWRPAPTTPPNETDLEPTEFTDVLRAARAGADWAWDRLYRDLAPAVLGYLRGQQLTDPEDVMGEVFLQAVRDLHRFDGGYAQFRSWLFTIAHHRMVDERRKVVRRPAVEPSPDEELHDLVADASPEDDAVARLTTEEIVDLLGDLTDDQRQVLLLRLVGGLSHAEVAEVLGRRRGAVKQLSRRALRALRAQLDDGAYPLEGA